MFQVGQKVTTEWGGGTVIGGTRGTTIKLEQMEAWRHSLHEAVQA